MSRPPRERVDRVLRQHETLWELGGNAEEACDVLGAEVRAMREEREWCGTNHGNNMCEVGLAKVRELQAEIEELKDRLAASRVLNDLYGEQTLLRNADMEELREAAQYHLEWGGVRNMDGGPKFPLCAEAQAAHERLSAVLEKVRL